MHYPYCFPSGKRGRRDSCSIRDARANNFRKTDDAERDIINPAIHATLNILESAHKAPGVKRVVITSSTAVITGGRPEEKDRVFTGASTPCP
jgi:nucleoside-diphosphate-sugar epimerase